MTRLLIIEDNPELVANLYAFFEPLGYVLDDARDGARSRAGWRGRNCW
jgi:hypothetical protein